MGCDIHPIAEVRKEGKWTAVTSDVFPLNEWDREYYKKDFGKTPFHWRSYSMFAFLAGVRKNYNNCEPLAEPKGMPDDASDVARELEEYWGIEGHSHSYLTLKELLEFDYDKTLEGEGEIVTYREELGPLFFEHLEALKTLGDPEDVRVVFLFDN